MEFKTKIYENSRGKSPYIEWINSLDNHDADKILVRVDRLLLGNFSNCKSLGSGLYELKIDMGPGYRIYLSTIEMRKILILCGGTKRTQKKDIEKAKSYLEDYEKRGKKYAKK